MKNLQSIAIFSLVVVAAVLVGQGFIELEHIMVGRPS